MTELTDSGILIRLAYEAMKSAGVDADEVLHRCNITPEEIQDRNLRTPHSAQGLFWQAAADVSGNPDIGLLVGRHLPPFKGQVLEYLFLSSPTFGEGLERALAYQRLLSDAVKGTLLFEGDQPYLTHQFGRRALRPLNESVALGVIRFFHSVTEGAFKPDEIWFDHEHGAPVAEYEEAFGCPVKTGMPETRIYFNSSILQRPSPHHEPLLLKAHEKVASEQVAELEKQDLVTKVEQYIGEMLESGQASLETVAERLAISPRALRARLSDAGTSFNQVLADYRCRLARRLLGNTEESIDEIVYLTGFSEPSTFYRAFKRWTGVTPVEYRKARQCE